MINCRSVGFLAILLIVQFPSAAQEKHQLQSQDGNSQGLEITASFDGLGNGFVGPQGTTYFRNPSDNSLAVGPNHIVQTVNARMAVFTKKGALFNETGKALYGPAETRNVFRDFGGPCERLNNGDAVVRYDQFADRWLLMMPTFRRAPLRNDSADYTGKWLPQPGDAAPLFMPEPKVEDRPAARPKLPPDTIGSYCMCYAVSASPDPMGAWFRYEFKRELFPDYPRPAIWHNGYYSTTSTGDHLNERHAFVADRNQMLRGLPASEQHFILKDVNFIIPADTDGKEMPPSGAPAILLATGGDQLHQITSDSFIYVWKQYTDWEDPKKSKLEGPERLPVVPYKYLGGGQLTQAIPQPGTSMRLDAQGDKMMARLVYRRTGNLQRMVGVHSVAARGQGGVRWYEFRISRRGKVSVHQQGTYAPGHGYRWMASPAIDGNGNIGIGYSYADSTNHPGQRFAGQSKNAPAGLLDLREVELVKGEASQSSTLRWEDYTQTAIDPSDDRTIWYVGDYLKAGATDYSTRISAVRITKQ